MAIKTLSADVTKGKRLLIKLEETMFAPVLPAKVEVLAPLITELEYLKKKNPALNLLIDTLDLQEKGPSKFISSNGGEGRLPDHVEEVARLEPEVRVPTGPPTPAAINKLRDIAANAFPAGSSYSKEEALSQIQTTANVSLERAQKGLELMIEHRILEASPAQTYYLFDSVPF